LFKQNAHILEGIMKNFKSPRWLLQILSVALLGSSGQVFAEAQVQFSLEQSYSSLGSPRANHPTLHRFYLAQSATPNGKIFIFYPGGLVPPSAYEFIARGLAEHGVTVAIPLMPFNLAVFNPNAADQVQRALERRGFKIDKLVLGGHSLGGAMASRYALERPIDGLVLMGAFPADTDDLSSRSFKVLNFAAEFDGLATLEKVQDGQKHLPKNNTLELLPGGVHAFFGRYGTQSGDGTPTVPRAEFEKQLLEGLVRFFDAL
jgi:pimeloyl-ACP methyl ester carboxylesterase